MSRVNKTSVFSVMYGSGAANPVRGTTPDLFIMDDYAELEDKVAAFYFGKGIKPNISSAEVLASPSAHDCRFNALPIKQTYVPKVNRRTKRW